MHPLLKGLTNRGIDPGRWDFAACEYNTVFNLKLARWEEPGRRGHKAIMIWVGPGQTSPAGYRWGQFLFEKEIESGRQVQEPPVGFMPRLALRVPEGEWLKRWRVYLARNRPQRPRPVQQYKFKEILHDLRASGQA